MTRSADAMGVDVTPADAQRAALPADSLRADALLAWLRLAAVVQAAVRPPDARPAPALVPRYAELPLGPLATLQQRLPRFDLPKVARGR